MAVIELAKPGQESTTYELIVSVGNAAITFGGIISTQLLGSTHAIGCTSPPCAPNTVNLKSIETYDDSNGPQRFTYYTCLLSKFLDKKIISD